MLPVLGLDVGTVRIGMAKSDELRLMAHPITTLKAEPRNTALDVIDRLVKEEGIQEIVVGYPKKLDGTIGPSAKMAEAFADAVRVKTGVTVVLWDERMTSAASQRLLIDRGMRRSARKGVVDQLAAVLILQSYLDAKRSRVT